MESGTENLKKKMLKIVLHVTEEGKIKYYLKKKIMKGSEGNLEKKQLTEEFKVLT